MKKTLLLALALSLILSACALPTFPQVTAPPAPDLVGTADVFVQETLLAQPTPTIIPSETPVVTTPTRTVLPPTETGTPTETQNPSLLTLTATLGTGTPASSVTGTPPTSTPTGTRNPSIGATPTETLYPRFFGTVPPDPPSGKITLLNKSRVEAYISLQCEDQDGKVTILEYPVRRQVQAKAPAGDYLFVAWVGGREMTGTFHLGKGGEITITLFKDKVVVSNK